MALIGFMGAGKSTVGRALAARLSWTFVDLDEALEERFGPIPDQVARDGWGVFRERERALALEACAAERAVLATGGGAWLDPQTRERLAERFHTVWLDVPLEVCASRVGAAAGRPAWDADVAERFRARRPVYALARHTVDGTAPVERVVEAIAAHLEGS